MDPITMAAIMGGAGLLKSELVDRPREERQRQQAAVTARWSPWTNMAPNQVREADPFGAALQGGITGAVMAQNLQGGDGKQKDLNEVASQQQPSSTWQQLETQNQSMMYPRQQSTLLGRR